MKNLGLKWIGSMATVSLLAIFGTANAGKIISTQSASGAEGFGGWDLGNVVVNTFKDLDGTVPTDSDFIEDTGWYDPETLHFLSTIQVSAATSTPMAILKGKDYPVGEPPGIKVINDDTKVKEGKPQNCIMTTSYLEEGFLGTTTPVQTTCSSGFQTHKRYKLNMQAGSLDTAGGAIDLVFKIENDGTSRDYQVFQKINNYTGERLSGFSFQVGTGVGPDFVAANGSGGIGLANLSIWASTDPTTGIWDDEDLANFAHGLFGPIDNHFPEEGFFSGSRAYFPVTKAEGPGLSDTFASSGDLTVNYTNVPPALGLDAQFGPWQYSCSEGDASCKSIEPYGIFHDDDADPTTDPVLKAFWGDTTNGSGVYDWMLGQTDGFATVDAATLNQWASDPLYYIGRIEDMLNLGVNFIVTVGDFAATSGTFTIRVIPQEYTPDLVGDPGYVANAPPELAVTVAEGVISISPKPEFNIGDGLSFLVADGSAGLVAANIRLTIENLSTGELERSTANSGQLDLTKLVDREGLFEGILATSNDPADNTNDDKTMYVEPGDIIKITYYDDDPSDNEPTDQTTAAGDVAFYIIPIPGRGAAIIGL